MGPGRGPDFPRKTGNTFSELDRLVIALGFSRAPEALDPLLRKLGQLKPDSELSHYQAISLALWDCLLPAAAIRWQSFSTSRGSRGTPRWPHHQTAGTKMARKRLRRRIAWSPPTATKQANGTNLNRAYRELIVAALLYRCGDRDGMAEAILQTVR